MPVWGPPGNENQQVQGLRQDMAFAYAPAIRIQARDDIVDEFLYRIGFHMHSSSTSPVLGRAVSSANPGFHWLCAALFAIAMVDKQIEQVVFHGV